MYSKMPTDFFSGSGWPTNWRFPLYVSVLRIPFSLGDAIPYASFLRDLTNDQNFFVFSGLGVSGSELSFSNVNILETYFQ